jgi:hypothetical protein
VGVINGGGGDGESVCLFMTPKLSVGKHLDVIGHSMDSMDSVPLQFH